MVLNYCRMLHALFMHYSSTINDSSITKEHSNQDQMCSVKILEYGGFRVYDGS